MHRFDFEGTIQPAIEFKEEKAPPAGGALLVKAFDEIFLDEIPVEEKQRLLTNLNKYIAAKESIPGDFEIFIEIGTNFTMEQVLKWVEEYLPNNNMLTPFLMTQLADKDSDYEMFITNCKEQNIKTLEIGGVFGNACVWLAAVKTGKNIYAKNIGANHPNIRFIDKDEGGYQFENAVILPSITEGQGIYASQSFLCFHQVDRFAVTLTPGLFEQETKQLAITEPQRFSATYEHLDMGMYTFLLSEIRQMLTPKDEKKPISPTLATFFSPSKSPEKIKNPRKDDKRLSLQNQFQEEQAVSAANKRRHHKAKVSKEKQATVINKKRLSK